MVITEDHWIQEWRVGSDMIRFLAWPRLRGMRCEEPYAWLTWKKLIDCGLLFSAHLCTYKPCTEWNNCSCAVRWGDCKGGSLAIWEAGKPPDVAVSCFLIFCLCLCSYQRTPETRRAACCVKAGLRAFAEPRETREINSLFSPTSLSDLHTESQPRSPKSL